MNRSEGNRRCLNLLFISDLQIVLMVNKRLGQRLTDYRSTSKYSWDPSWTYSLKKEITVTRICPRDPSSSNILNQERWPSPCQLVCGSSLIISGLEARDELKVTASRTPLNTRRLIAIIRSIDPLLRRELGQRLLQIFFSFSLLKRKRKGKR